MIEIERSALLPYSAEQMFVLVNDIESYPQFMHGCRDAEVISRSDDELIGRLELGKGAIRQAFTTRNQLQPHTEMRMSLVEGPFRHFSAVWRFQALGETACKVSLSMRFEFSGGFFGRAVEKLFEASSNLLVEDMVKRAEQVYGKP